MNIQFDTQLLMIRHKTGIDWTAEKLVESLAKTNQQDQLVLNYFSMFHISQNRDSIHKLMKLGCRLNECRWFHSALYKLLYNFIPIPYSLFFGSKADITHFMNYHVPPGVKGKVVTMIYDMVYKVYPETMNTRTRVMLNLSMKNSCKRADIIVTISQFSKNEIMKFLNVPSEKIVVMPCGVDLKLYRPDYSMEDVHRVKSKYRVEGEYLLYLGTLEPRKNIERLVKAYHILKQHITDIPKLVIAGHTGWQYDSIFKEVSILNMHNNVIFTGYIDAADSPVLMKGATLFVFPSLYEGFGMPPLEAMACGTPVVTSNVASLPEVVGDAALLVDPYSVEAIAGAMERLIMDESLRSEVSQKGLARAKLYTWENSASIIMDVYKKLTH